MPDRPHVSPPSESDDMEIAEIGSPAWRGGCFNTPGNRDFGEFRAALRRAGFTQPRVQGILEDRNDRNVDLAVALLRTEAPTAFNVLVRLFVLHASVSADALAAAIAPARIDDLFAAGLVTPVGNVVEAVARLTPWRDLFLLADFLPPPGEPLPADFVMSGASPSSVSLAALTVRRKVEKALDLGTGSGVHALLAAAHADHVVATDANPRAIDFTRMNARLNGIGNVTALVGSFFEPVEGERFDLIVSNPPFLVAPPADLLFQGIGVGGDAVSERVVREAPAHLREGGFAITLASWPHGGDEDWPDRPRAWSAESGCDTWILRVADDDPLSYAANALRQTAEVGSARYSELLDTWLEYYREQDFRRLAIGAVMLRKRSASQNWTRWDAISSVVRGDASDQILRVFDVAGLLAVPDCEERLLDLPLRIHPDHSLEQELAMEGDDWKIASSILGSTRGIRFRAALDSRTLAFLRLLDGRRTLREALSKFSADNGMESAAGLRAGLPIVRRLLEIGLLIAS